MIERTIERLLADLGSGDRATANELFALVYDELKTLAHRQRQRWRGDHTCNTTAIVHEVYVKLVGQTRVSAESRTHFRALAARAMRHVLCDYARERGAKKRGGGLAQLPPTEKEALLQAAEANDPREQHLDTLIELDSALRKLQEVHPRASEVVECRFFGGLTVEETAQAIGTSPRSVKRDWALAQAWLHREMESGNRLPDGGSGP